MTAPDCPENTPKFVVDTISLNPLELLPPSADWPEPHLSASIPIKVWRFQDDPDVGKPADALTRDRPPVLLSMWPHVAPTPCRDVPLMTDLNRSLVSDCWRFEIENVPAEVGYFFDRPHAAGFQIQMWLDPQHLPPDHAEIQEYAGKRPGWPSVFLFHVPGVYRTSTGMAGRTLTISGAAEAFPHHRRVAVSVALSPIEARTRQGQVWVAHRGVPRPGIYASYDQVDANLRQMPLP